MRKFLIALVGLLFTLPVLAQPVHWTCSNDQTVLYMVVEPNNNLFFMFDDHGTFVASSTFAPEERNGIHYYYAEMNTAHGKTAIAVAGTGKENSLIMVLTDASLKVVKMECN
jgi:hypothetical protein